MKKALTVDVLVMILLYLIRQLLKPYYVLKLLDLFSILSFNVRLNYYVVIF